MSDITATLQGLGNGTVTTGDAVSQFASRQWPVRLAHQPAVMPGDDLASDVAGGKPAAADLTAGCVTGDPGVIGMLRGLEGEPWQATPTGPAGTLDLTDPGSVLGALMDHTDITAITGDAPDILGPQVAGAVY